MDVKLEKLKNKILRREIENLEPLVNLNKAKELLQRRAIGEKISDEEILLVLPAVSGG